VLAAEGSVNSNATSSTSRLPSILNASNPINNRRYNFVINGRTLSHRSGMPFIPCLRQYRWKPIGSRDVEAPTEGGELSALPPGRFLVLISVPELRTRVLHRAHKIYLHTRQASSPTELFVGLLRTACRCGSLSWLYGRRSQLRPVAMFRRRSTVPVPGSTRPPRFLRPLAANPKVTQLHRQPRERRIEGVEVS
jgi:hypothetical protein